MIVYETAPKIDIDWPENLQLNVQLMRDHNNTTFHSHSFSELVIVLRGSALHASPWGEYPIGAGDVFVLHGDQAHAYRETRSLDLVNILFRMEQLTLPVGDIATTSGYHVLFTLEPALRQFDGYDSRLRLTPRQLQDIDMRIRDLLAERDSQSPGWQFAMTAHFMLIVTDLCRIYSHTQDPGARSLLQLGDVLGYMHQHYAQQITLDDLARVGCMSRRTLTRLFTKAMGVSPIDYLIRERVNRALDLLTDRGVTVSEAAFRVGFHDSNYFSRKFRAIVGRSPSEARNKAI